MSPEPPPIRRAVDVVADAALLILILLGLAVLAPVYQIASHAFAPRIEEEHAFLAWLLRVSDFPILVAVIVLVFAALARIFGALFKLPADRVVAGSRKVARYFVLVALLERFTFISQSLIPHEIGRLLVGGLLILIGAIARFEFSANMKKVAFLVAGGGLAADAIAAWIWDSGWVTFDCALVVLVVAVAGYLRHRSKSRWFIWLRPLLTEAMDELRTFATHVRADGLRPLMRRATRESSPTRLLDSSDPGEGPV